MILDGKLLLVLCLGLMTGGCSSDGSKAETSPADASAAVGVQLPSGARNVKCAVVRGFVYWAYVRCDMTANEFSEMCKANETLPGEADLSENMDILREMQQVGKGTNMGWWDWGGLENIKSGRKIARRMREDRECEEGMLVSKGTIGDTVRVFIVYYGEVVNSDG